MDMLDITAFRRTYEGFCSGASIKCNMHMFPEWFPMASDEFTKNTGQHYAQEDITSFTSAGELKPRTSISKKIEEASYSEREKKSSVDSGEERVRGFLGQIDNYNRLSEDLKTGIIHFFLRHLDKDPYSSSTLAHICTLIKDNRLNQQVLDELNRLDNPDFKLAEGIEREKLISQVIKDIAAPYTIRQGCKNTCAATAVQMVLAVKNPVRYLQIVAALTGKEGDASSIVPGLVRDEGTPIRVDIRAGPFLFRLFWACP